MNLKNSVSLLVAVLFLLSATPSLSFELAYVAGSETSLSNPHDITLSPDQRYLYVADNNNDVIAVLDPMSLELLGSFGRGEVSQPHDVVFQTDGKLLVADTGNSRIAVYEVSGATGRFVSELKGGFSRPEGVVVHSNGRVYVTGAGSGNIVALDKGKSVAKAGGLSAPHDVDIASDGTIWVADAGNNRLLHLSEDLKMLNIIEGSPYDFDGPRYLDFDSKGRLYVADKYANQVKVLAPDNKLIYTVGKNRAGLGPGLFDRPEGVVIHNQDVWFSDTYNNRIVRYRIVE